MRYPGAEKREIIRLVGESHLPVKQTLEMLGVSRPTFYRWLDILGQMPVYGIFLIPKKDIFGAMNQALQSSN